MSKNEKMLREVVSLLIEAYKEISNTASSTTATSNAGEALKGGSGPVKEADGEGTETRK